MPPAIVQQLPVFRSLLKWFKGDELVIDNYLFKLHHQASTFVIMFGFLFIFIENYLDGRSIICQGGDKYANAYCWIHGTAYIRPHLQGKATGCYVDQTQLDSPENAPVTAYYLWLPFLLIFCFGFAKFPRSLWRNLLEGNMLQRIMQDKSAMSVYHNFVGFRQRFKRYHFYFGFCEFLNLIMVILSMAMSHSLLRHKFWGYGQEVLNYIWSEKHIGPDGKYLTHDPMCELFPTEVACYIRIGATTGGIDQSNYLCILSNNLFNQKYFLVLWIWWVALCIMSVIGLIYRMARITVPGLSRSILVRHVKSHSLDNLDLSSADSFVLDMLAANIEHDVLDEVLDLLREGGASKIPSFDSIDDNHNKALIGKTDV